MSEQPVQLTTEERLLGGISHLLGIIWALIIWAIEKDKSRFVRFQAMQAVAFDGAVMVVMLVVVGVVLLLTFLILAILMILVGILASQGNQDFLTYIIPISTMFPFFLFLIFVPVGLALTVVRLIASIRVFQGTDFHYPWLGNQVKKWLTDQ